MSFESFGSKESGSEKSAALEHLKEVGVSLANRFNAFEGKTFDAMQDIKPNTWNENSGVIIFADHSGEVFAVPSTDRYRNELFKDQTVTKDESIGVPSLSNTEVWSNDPTQAETVPGFQEWNAAVHSAKAIRTAERQERENKEAV
ncbi:hypothetical protein GW766_01900 [Candidatus Parcubacteria bacterium]|nr:hypothetical protein [Candidatus Parcubacteria bacterium]